jgi:hypothetical protein
MRPLMMHDTPLPPICSTLATLKLDAIGEASCLNDIVAKEKVPWYKQFQVKNNITNKEYEK